MPTQKIYYKRLDIIRNISCILVLLYHLNILKGGFLAVCIFFTLSGYLSCMSAIKKQNFSIKSYYANRIKKIYFPLIMVVFITVILAKISTSINWSNLKPETISVILGYNNFWQLNANLDYFTRNVNSPFIHLWYISILLQFDLVFPIIVSALRKVEKKKNKNIATIAVSLLTIITTVLFYYMSKTQNIMVVYYNTIARCFSIFFGILLAVIHYKYNFNFSKIFQKWNTYIFIIYNIALIILCIFMTAENNNYAIYMILTTIISTRLIEYSINPRRNIGRINKYIKKLAEISYEVYLVQYPVIFFMQNISIDNSLKALLIIILTFIISFILNLLTNDSLKSKLIKKIKVIFLSIIIVVGSFIVIIEKDHSKEMKELENRLNENSKILEEKNQEYMNANVTNKEKTNGKEESNEVVDNKSSENTKEDSVEDTNSRTNENVGDLPVVGVGDSVLLEVVKELYSVFPKGYFNGKISQTISGAEKILENLKSEGKLGNIVILSLATNGDYSEKKNKELMNILEDREIYWVEAAGPDDPKFNERFRDFASNYSNIHIVEWENFAKNHPEYIEPDGVHPNYKGGKVWVELIYDTISKTHKNE